MHIGHYRAHRSSVNVKAGEFLVTSCCGHWWLARVQTATRESHSKVMHGGLIAMMTSILGQAVPEPQIAGAWTKAMDK